MNDESSNSSENSTLTSLLEIQEAPFHVLMDRELDQMTEDELKVFCQTVQEERVSPALRAKKARKESNKILGVTKTKTMVDLGGLL